VYINITAEFIVGTIITMNYRGLLKKMLGANNYFSSFPFSINFSKSVYYYLLV